MNSLRRFFRQSVLYDFGIACILVVSSLVLVGWIVGNKTLTSVLPQFTPMNPVTAICFALVGLTLFIRRHSNSPKGRWVPTLIAGGICFVVGVIMLLKYSLGIDLYIDRIFFNSKLGINRMAITTSFNFFLLGICLITRPHVIALRKLLEASIAIVATYAFAAYLYNFVGIYGQTIFNPMAIHTAFLFMVTSLYLLLEDHFWSGRFIDTLRKRRLFLPFVALITFLVSMAVVTSFSILLKSALDSQSQTRFKNQTSDLTNSIQSNMDEYVNLSYGLEGLFNASDSVTADDWHTYVTSLDLPTHYQGVSGILYAQRVADSDVSKLPFTIYPASTRGYYLPITYVSTSTATSSALGFDFLSDPRRRAAIEEAVRTSSPVASPVVRSATGTSYVFSVYAPIFTHGTPHATANERNSAYMGVISIAFRPDHIFPSLIEGNPIYTKAMHVRIYDTPTPVEHDVPLYQTSSSTETASVLTSSNTVSVGGRIWTVVYSSSIQSNKSRVEQLGPLILFGVGILLSLLFAYIAYRLIRERERALSTKTLQLDTLIRNFPYGVIIEDEKRNVVFANQRVMDLFSGEAGADASTLIGKNSTALTHEMGDVFEDVKAYLARTDEILASGSLIMDDKIHLVNDRVIARDYVPLNDGGERIGGIWTYKDVTDLEHIDRMKTEFVSLASHQLRTPLTSIKWYTELLMEDSKTLDDEHREYAEEIRDAANRMNTLVGALLDISRLDLGTFMIEPEPADVVAIMQSAVDEQKASVEEKHQTLTFTHPDSLPPLPVDSKLLFIIVQNLISNAHKYSPEGASITVSIEKLPTGAYAITVADTGYGIPATDQPNIFKKLFRADNIRTLDVEGTGLGLYMIKTIAEASDCEISFVSKEKKGTTFSFLIPATGMKAKSGTKTLGE